MFPPDTFPFITNAPPDVTLITVLIVEFVEPGETFPLTVKFPLAAENVRRFAEPDPGPVRVADATVNPPEDTVNPPPTAADVPPPTNEAVMAAFVMRATSTF